MKDQAKRESKILFIWTISVLIIAYLCEIIYAPLKLYHDKSITELPTLQNYLDAHIVSYTITIFIAYTILSLISIKLSKLKIKQLRINLTIIYSLILIFINFFATVVIASTDEDWKLLIWDIRMFTCAFYLIFNFCFINHHPVYEDQIDDTLGGKSEIKHSTD
jgi:uncharacterized protein YacL